MPLVVTCVKCGKKMGVPDRAAGKPVQCPTCKVVFTPQVATPAPAPKTPMTPAKASPNLTPKAPPAKAPAKPSPIQAAKKSPAPPAPRKPMRRDAEAFDDDDAPIRRPGKRGSGLVWILVSVGALALLGGGGFLAWDMMRQRALTEEERLALELKKALEAEFGKKFDNDIPIKIEAPKIKIDPLAPKQEEPKLPKQAEPKQEAPKQVTPKQEEPKKVETPKKIEVPEIKIDPPKKEEPKKVEPPPKDEVAAAGDGWHAVKSFQGRFEVAMPGQPELGRAELNMLDDSGPEYLAKHPKEDLVFRAAALQLSGNDLSISWDVTYTQLVQRLMPDLGFLQFKKQKDIKYEGQRCREFIADDNKSKKLSVGRYFRMNDVPGKSRIFFFSVTGPGASLEMPDVAKFLDSVKFQPGEMFVQRKAGLTVDPANETPHYVLKGGKRDAMGVAFTRDGKTMYSAWGDGTVKAWDAATMTEKAAILTPDPEKDKNKNLRGLALSPDDKTLALFDSGNVIQLLDIATGKIDVIEDEKTRGIHFGFEQVAFSADGKWLVTMTGLAGQVKVFDLLTSKPLYPAIEVQARCIALTPDKSLLAIGPAAFNRLILHDAATGKELARLPARDNDSINISGASLRGMAITPDGKRVAAGWDGEHVFVWSLAAKKQRPPIRPGTGGQVGPIAMSSDGNLLAVSTSKGIVQFWDVPTVTRRGAVRFGKSVFTPRTVTMSPDDKRLVVVYNEQAFVWDMERVVLDKVDVAKAIADPTPDPVKVAKLDPKKDPDKKDPPKVDPKTPDKKGTPGAGDVGKIAGKIETHYGVVVDPEAKTALLFLPAGQAKLYAYPDFKAIGTYKLAGGSAYRPIFDKATGKLYALSPSAKAKDPTGKKGGSQVLVYDIRELLDGKAKPKSEIAPIKSIDLGGFCAQLCLAPGGDFLYVLEVANPKAPKAMRVDLAMGEVLGVVPMPEYTDGLVLARDGKKLYAMAHAARASKAKQRGTILVMDTAEMALQKSITIDADPADIDVTNAGMVFVAGYGSTRADITLLDVTKEMPVIATWKGVPASSCLKLTGDEKRLFVSSWKGTPAAVTVLTLPEALADSELPKAQWSQSPPVVVRGEVYITPDSRYLLCESGVVFNLGGN